MKKIDENSFKVWVKEASVNGRGKQAVEKLLASYFDISKSQIQIISDKFSTCKVIKIEK